MSHMIELVRFKDGKIDSLNKLNLFYTLSRLGMDVDAQNPAGEDYVFAKGINQEEIEQEVIYDTEGIALNRPCDGFGQIALYLMQSLNLIILADEDIGVSPKIVTLKKVLKKDIPKEHRNIPQHIITTATEIEKTLYED